MKTLSACFIPLFALLLGGIDQRIDAFRYKELWQSLQEAK